MKGIACLFLDVSYDFVYVENVVLGHLLLEEKMREDPNKVGGEAFNISNNETMPL